MKSKTLLTILLTASCSLTTQAALLDFRSASTVQYKSDTFSAPIGCNPDDCSASLGITYLTLWEATNSPGQLEFSLASEFKSNSFTLQSRQLSPDGREVQMMGEFQSQGLKNRLLVSTGNLVFLINFKIVSCENRPITSGTIDYSDLSPEAIIENLNQITPSDALFCDLQATHFEFVTPVQTNVSWAPRTILRVYHDGRVSAQTYPHRTEEWDFPSYPINSGRALGLELHREKSTATDSRVRALAAATEFSDLLKQYAEVLLLSCKANSGVKDLAVEQFFKQNGKRIVTLKKNIEAEITQLEVIDIFSILMPINQSYDYIKALERKLNKELTFDHSVRSFGN